MSEKPEKDTGVPHDSDYFRRRSAEARAAAYCKEHDDSVEVAGDLALAYAALARRRAKAAGEADLLPPSALPQPV
jgi:hypothetical protein